MTVGRGQGVGGRGEINLWERHPSERGCRRGRGGRRATWGVVRTSSLEPRCSLLHVIVVREHRAVKEEAAEVAE